MGKTMDLDELEKRKVYAMEKRDLYSTLMNEISIYRMLTHKYIPLTRDMIESLDTSEENEELLESIRTAFAFIMSYRSIECKGWRDEDILRAFFGDRIDDPETKAANYEYMAYVVLNETAELEFRIIDLTTQKPEWGVSFLAKDHVL